METLKTKRAEALFQFLKCWTPGWPTSGGRMGGGGRVGGSKHVASWRPTSPSPPLANPSPHTLGKRHHRKTAEATKPSRSMQCCTRFLAEFSDRAPQRRADYTVNPQRARQRPEPSHNVCEPLRPLLCRYGVTLAGEEREHTNSPTARANPAPGSGSNTARPHPFRDNPPRQ